MEATHDENDRANSSGAARSRSNNCIDRTPGEAPNLPSECWVQVVSFLSLYDCLSFGSTSVSALNDIQPYLAKRSQCMTQTRYYSSLKDPRVFSSWQFVRQPVGENGTAEHNANEDDDPIYRLPTVRDRIECLRRSLPPTSRFYESVNELLSVLDESNHTDEDDEEALLDDHETSLSRLLSQHRKHTKSHKLHAIILRDAIYSLPPIYGTSTSRTPHRIPKPMEFTLQNYMGDVLCAYFLMGHSASGIVEGGPTEKLWMDGIMAELSKRKKPVRGASTVHLESLMYRAWVFLHSTVLRTAPFTLDQQLRLGLASSSTPYTASPPPFHDVDALAEGDDVPPGGHIRQVAMHPHYPFYGEGKMEIVNRLSCLDPLSSLKVKCNNLERLGLYRDRDLMESQVTAASVCIGHIGDFDGMPLSYLANPEVVSSELSNWFDRDGRSSLWLFELFEESQKTREPPIVIITYPPRGQVFRESR